MDPIYWFEISRKVLIAASIIAALGSIVAAAGGYGVLYFGRKVSTIQELKIAENNREAAEAKRNAAIADQNSAEANVRAESAIKEAAVANSNAALAEQKAAEANHTAAEVNQLAADANYKAKQAELRSQELEVQAKELTLQIDKAKVEAENAKLERDKLKLSTTKLKKKADNLQSEAESLKAETRNNDIKRKQDIENIRKYAEISKMGVFGGKLTYIGKEKNTIKETSGIITNMKKALKPNGNKVDIIVSEEAIQAAQNVIKIEPLFPFSYWVLAHNYAKNNDRRWLENANKAIEILEETTKINGHKDHHDNILKWLYNLKKQNGIE